MSDLAFVGPTIVLFIESTPNINRTEGDGTYKIFLNDEILGK